MMLTVNEAITQLLAVADVRAEVESIPVVKALGRILADDINAYVNVPPADNSAMDGYAFNFKQAINAGFKLPVSQKVPAGTPPEPLQAGSAARVFTGAEIPLGADSVAPQEICLEENGIVFLASDLTPNCHIRNQGQDTQAGSLLLSAGSALGATKMGLLASQGIVDVAVYKPLRVAIFSTGDELVEPGVALQ
ncbi:MAG: molybdopterin molybdenumtransferase MoeA, partial [Porticoccaceae bacterium]|nr:molybdopterin molybdenumtransferase MoeA [Porticoccaceae bacterium]